MARPIKIAISGAQCSGKTTLLEALKKDNFFKHFDFVKSFATSIAEKGPHSEDTELTTQLRMLYASVEQLKKNIYAPTVFDRCILDVIVYTGALDESYIDILFGETFETHYKDIDIIFILGTEDIALDTSKSSRSINESYREKINKIFRNVELPNAIQIPAGLSIEERVCVIKNKIIELCEIGKLNKDLKW